MPTMDPHATSPRTDRRTSLYAFRLILDGVYEPVEEVADKLFEAGCDDAAFGVSAGMPDLVFSREGATLSDAIESAIEDLGRAGTGLRVVRVELNDRPSEDQVAVLGAINASLTGQPV